MSAELIKRIDEWLAEILPDDLAELLQDCRAALSQKVRYVPMTQPELYKLWSINASLLSIQDEIIRRAIAQGAKLEMEK